MFDLYSATILITFFILLITVIEAATNKLVSKSIKAKVMITCMFIAFAALGEFLGVVTNGAPSNYIPLHIAAKAVEFCFAPVCAVFAGIAYGESKYSKAAVLLVFLHAVFEVIAVKFNLVFSVDKNNVYSRQFLYAVYVRTFILSIVFALINIIGASKKYQVGVDGVLVSIFTLLTVGIGIQFVFSGIRIDYLCIATVNYMLFARHNKLVLQVDAVTGLLNRRCYDVNITDLGSHAMILIFDADKFKNVNDTYGHSVGDICLKNIARRLQSVYGKYGICYRIGGDEFCVILHNNFENIRRLNRMFFKTVDDIIRRDERMPRVSMGYAFYDAASTHIQTVIEEADAMLYKNKNKTQL